MKIEWSGHFVNKWKKINWSPAENSPGNLLKQGKVEETPVSIFEMKNGDFLRHPNLDEVSSSVSASN